MSLIQPVRYAVSYYSHLDVGAPELTDTDGAVKAILKAGLVTGYGAKQGAGWESLFDDAYRFVVRPPDAALHGLPDIKIENGDINGAIKHRIISQNNPVSIDDTNEIASVNLASRDSKTTGEWHLIVTDKAFLLCYSVGETWSFNRGYATFCGCLQNAIDDNAVSFFASADDKVLLSGKVASNSSQLTSDGMIYKNMLNNTTSIKKSLLTTDVNESASLGAAFMQKAVFFDDCIMPFYFAIAKHAPDFATHTLTVDGRPMLRYVNRVYQQYSSSARAMYIPLDYWEF